VLPPFPSVTYDNRIAQILDTDFVYGDVTGVTLVLNIFHGFRFSIKDHPQAGGCRSRAQVANPSRRHVDIGAI
jgi:hypothetical protein